MLTDACAALVGGRGWTGGGRPEYRWEERKNGELLWMGDGDTTREFEKGNIGADFSEQKEPGMAATTKPVHTTSAEEIASRYPGVELPPKWRAVAGGDLRFLEILYKLKSMPLKPVQKGKWPPTTREELSRLVVYLYGCTSC
jgi:hypothetical protein